MNIIEVMQLPAGSEVKNSKGESFILYLTLAGLDKRLFEKGVRNEMFKVDFNETNILENYTLVKEDKKVDFMQSMKAYMEGKKVYCKFKTGEDAYTCTYELEEGLEEGSKLVLDTDGDCISIGEILEGQWYIKNE